ncbi:hypothetical protein WJX74_009507 [Apatococcus lobatus]|uniref:Uncharacterized protein n=1 Tax=Apatococcus lobatus TaxID=904363 RepID=A0AAW1RJT5_9CHLO
MSYQRQEGGEVKTALRFAATFEELQGQMVAMLWQLVMKPAMLVKTCRALLAAVLVPGFPPAQVNKQILPALVTLSNDADMGMRELSIDALAEMLKLYGSSRAVMDALMNSNVMR